jgi:hypothetical protein
MAFYRQRKKGPANLGLFRLHSGLFGLTAFKDRCNVQWDDVRHLLGLQQSFGLRKLWRLACFALLIQWRQVAG